MRKLLPSNKICLAPSQITKAGRGVFATQNIKKGQVIEVCPVILVPRKDVSNLKESILVNYYFYFGRSQKDKSRLAVALGYGSIYNHSYQPNATYIKKPTEKVINFVALMNIRKGQEITVNYNFGNPEDKSKLWIHGIPRYKESN